MRHRHTDRPLLNTFEIIIVHHCRDNLKLQHVSLIGALFCVSGESENFYLFLGASPWTVTMTYIMAP